MDEFSVQGSPVARCSAPPLPHCLRCRNRKHEDLTNQDFRKAFALQEEYQVIQDFPDEDLTNQDFRKAFALQEENQVIQDFPDEDLTNQDFRKAFALQEENQVIQDFPVSPSGHVSCNLDFLGIEGKWYLSSAQKDFNAPGSPMGLERGSNSVEVSKILMEMQDRIRMLRCENLEMKRALTRLLSLAQATHSEVTNLGDKVDIVSAINMDISFDNVISGIKTVEKKVDLLRDDIGHFFTGWKAGGGSVKGNSKL